MRTLVTSLNCWYITLLNNQLHHRHEAIPKQLHVSLYVSNRNSKINSTVILSLLCSMSMLIAPFIGWSLTCTVHKRWLYFSLRDKLLLFVFNPLRGMHPLHLSQLQKCVAVARWSRTMAGELLLNIFFFLAWMKQELPEETNANTAGTSKYHTERLQSGLEERPAVRRHWIITSPTVLRTAE